MIFVLLCSYFNSLEINEKPNITLVTRLSRWQEKGKFEFMTFHKINTISKIGTNIPFPFTHWPLYNNNNNNIYKIWLAEIFSCHQFLFTYNHLEFDWLSLIKQCGWIGRNICKQMNRNKWLVVVAIHTTLCFSWVSILHVESKRHRNRVQQK